MITAVKFAIYAVALICIIFIMVFSLASLILNVVKWPKR